MGGPTTHAGTNGTHEYEHAKQCRPEGEDPISGRSNEFDYGDESTNYMGENPVQWDSMENSSRNQGSGTVSTNTTSRGVKQSMLDGQTTEIWEQMGDVNMDNRRNIHMQHTNADTRQSQFFQDSRQNDKRPENSSEDEVSIRRVFPDDGIFTNLVKDSVSAQVRDGIRPMFVNNYYVGDNSWRPGVQKEIPKQPNRSTRRLIDQIRRYKQLSHPFVRFVNQKVTCKLESLE